jgi:hypothetical protein
LGELVLPWNRSSEKQFLDMEIFYLWMTGMETNTSSGCPPG